MTADMAHLTFENNAFRSLLEEVIALHRDDASAADLARLYATSVTAYRAANIRANAISCIPFRVKQGDQELKSHPLVRLVSTPAFSDIQLRSELTLCFWGHNLLFKQRMHSGRLDLRWLNPRVYQPDIDVLHGLRGFRILGATDRTAVPGYLTRFDGIYCHGVDFDNDFGGVAPAEVAFDHAGIETEAAQTALWFLRNRAIPGGIVQPAKDRSSDPDQTARHRLQDLLQRFLKGSRNAGRTVVTAGRWEWLQLSQEFDKIGMVSLFEQARIAVAEAFDMSIELLMMTGTYAGAYQVDSSWVEHWLKPRANWYAGQYTMQLAHEFGPDIVLEPDFSHLKRDEQAVTAVVNSRVQAGYLSLYEAQSQTSGAADERLKDIYLIGTTPLHINRIRELATQTTAVSPPPFLTLPDGDASTIPDKLPPRPPEAVLPAKNGAEPAATPLPPTAQADAPWLPDGVYKELRDCVRILARKGAVQTFTPVHLPLDVVAYVRLLAATDTDAEPVLRAARVYYHQREGALAACKAYAEVERRYRAALYGLLHDAFGRRLDQAAFVQRGMDEIQRAFERAFLRGVNEAGTPTGMLTPGEAAYVREQAAAEGRYWDDLAGDVFGKALPLYQQSLDKLEDVGRATTADARDQLRGESLALLSQFYQARERFFSRVEAWTKALRGLYNQGLTSGHSNPMLRWDLGRTEKHCRTCRAAAGQIHRASEWAKYNLRPQGVGLHCSWGAGGNALRCDCRFTVVQAPAHGRLDRVPRFWGQRAGGYCEADDAVKSSFGPAAGTVVVYLADTEDLLTQQQFLQRSLPSDAPLRWTPVEHLHVTLVHAALVDEPAFRAIYQDVSGSFAGFELRLTQIGTFPADGAVIPLIGLVELTDDLRAFQAQVVHAFHTRGIPIAAYSQPDQWQPHITLGYAPAAYALINTGADLVCTADVLAFTRCSYETDYATEEVRDV